MNCCDDNTPSHEVSDLMQLRAYTLHVSERAVRVLLLTNVNLWSLFQLLILVCMYVDLYRLICVCMMKKNVLGYGKL